MSEGIEESKHIATHPHVGRGSSLMRSESFQKRTARQAVKELDTLKLNTIRKMYAPLTSLIYLRNLPKNTKKQNRENDRKAEELKILAIKHLSELHRSAFSKGLQVADNRLHLNMDDDKWLTEFMKTEAGYFSKFADAVRAGSLSVKQTDYRLRMYMNSALATFEAGRVVGSTPGSLIYWIRDPVKDHCKVCNFLADNSPYVPSNLPTVPKSDACEGYSNCGCRLSFVKVDLEVMRVAKSRMKSKKQLMNSITLMKKRHAS